MADINFGHFDETNPSSGNPPGRSNRLVHLAGAACSVALIVGSTLWGYKLAVRDISGVPVYRALAEPMRIAPETPGGDVALNQGLSVNAVAAAGASLPLSESLVLAPKPVELALDDLPVATGTEGVDAAPAMKTVAMATGAAEITAAAATLDVGPPVEVSAESLMLPDEAEQSDAINLAIELALADTAGAVAPSADDPASEAELAAMAGDPGIAVATSLRPVRRPQGAADAPAVEPVVASATIEVDPTTITAGARLAQLGAYDSAEKARSEWGALQARFSGQMAGKSMVVQEAQSGGRTFFRLRAFGFADEDDARLFCAALLAENASCIPVVHR